MPTISVIIPAYNAERTIQETVKSVLEQTFSDFELIIIDDGSTDRTLDLIQKIAVPRIRCFSYENGGVAVARNRGIFHAMGEFIAFLDADDLWTSDKLERQFKALEEHSEAAVAYSWTYFLDENENNSYADTSSFYEGDVYANLLVKNFLHNGSNCLVRKQAIDAVGLFDGTLTHCEDWDFYIRLAFIYPFVLVPKPQVIYRQVLGTATSKVDVMEKSILTVIDRAFKVAPPEHQHLKQQSLAWGYKYLVQQYLKYEKGNFDSLRLAVRKLLKAIYIQPSILGEDYTQALIRRIVKQWILMNTPIVF
jgi:glycosyltransferase involved in cell wall biosynthesis